MPKTATISRVPNDTARALEDAERELKLPPDGKSRQIQIPPALVTTRPELFQPRCFWQGTLDQEHVQKLIKRINTKGELDPPLVVKLGRKWVCVDGHHRLAAYLRTTKYRHGSPFTIICEWFSGSVREAVDESIRRNDIDKLEMRPGDRYEAAWQRTVLGWGSKSEVVRLTNVSDGLVGEMRRVVAAYEGQDVFAKDLRKKLPGGLAEHSWSAARIAYHNVPETEWEAREEGAKFAKTLRNRLHNKLSDNPTVTAYALMIYDSKLPRKLIEAFTEVLKEEEEVEEGLGPRASTAHQGNSQNI